MGDTNIEWTDKSWNPTRGCSRVSTGCEKCYAMHVAARFSGPGQPYEGLAKRDPTNWTGVIRLVPEKLGDPMTWRKPCRVFVNSMSDLFHEDVPDEFIAAVFGVMASCPDHTFQVLTKRADRLPRWFAWVQQAKRGYWHEENGLLMDCLRKYGEAVYEKAKPGYKRAARLRWPDLVDPCTSLGDSSLGPDWPLPNVMLGVSVENQNTADQRIPHLLNTPAAVRFLSVEPLLSRVDLRAGIYLHGGARVMVWEGRGTNLDGIDQVIVGAESGRGARPMDEDWVRLIRDQCQATGTAFFYKQKVAGGHKVSLPELDGRQWAEFPKGVAS